MTLAIEVTCSSYISVRQISRMQSVYRCTESFGQDWRNLSPDIFTTDNLQTWWDLCR